MTSALDLINAALRLLQVNSEDVILTASEANQALEALNLLLASWSNDGTLSYHLSENTLNLTAGQNCYRLGPGGDLAIRPQAIERATLAGNGGRWPLTALSYADWAGLNQPTTPGDSRYFYLDDDYPLARLYVYPVPVRAMVLTLYNRQPLAGAMHLTDGIDLPPGYLRALKYQLAVELAQEYQLGAGNELRLLALEAKAALRRTNRRSATLRVDPALLSSGGGFSVFRGV